ncbi:hypothetical protein BVRB_6g143770 [Beta vulgaris subsp. vulgaris]|nr:hypothetical protein BVRB_6g143770 [Beta vulgaris subsp. vulgaris]
MQIHVHRYNVWSRQFSELPFKARVSGLPHLEYHQKLLN